MTIQELIDELDKIEDKEQIIIKYTSDGYVLEIAASVFNTTPKKMTLEEIETELGYKVRLVEWH